jgi:hypothetical protein
MTPRQWAAVLTWLASQGEPDVRRRAPGLVEGRGEGDGAWRLELLALAARLSRWRRDGKHEGWAAPSRPA